MLLVNVKEMTVTEETGESFKIVMMLGVGGIEVSKYEDAIYLVTENKDGLYQNFDLRGADGRPDRGRIN